MTLTTQTTTTVVSVPIHCCPVSPRRWASNSSDVWEWLGTARCAFPPLHGEVRVMSRETSEWLNQNTLIGFTDQRGHAWHYRASDQGDQPNHYPGALPVEDVKRRLFAWDAVECPLSVTLPDGDVVKV